MSLYICRGPDVVDDGYRCGCCGYTSPNMESFTIGGCWPCAFAMNHECRNCLRLGIEATDMDNPRGRVHRLRTKTITACGLRWRGRRISGPGDRPACRRCWEDRDAVSG